MNLNETLIDVIFDKVIYNVRVLKTGDISEFKVYLPGSKSAMSLKLRNKTVRKFKKWFDGIYEEMGIGE